MKKIKFILLSILVLSLFSCLREEGEGGTATVQGKIFKVFHPDDTYSFKTDTMAVQTDSFKTENYFIKTDTFPASKEDVYIMYGDEPTYGDKMEAGYDGFYRFRYLVKGTYRVFAYSSYLNGERRAEIDTVTVKNGETKNARNIYIHTGKSLETSYIKGTVRVTNYNKGVAVPGAILQPACDVRVFIREKGAAFQFDEVRTGKDGIFMFQGIAPGQYEVFVMTEHPTNELLTPVSRSIKIEKTGIIKTFKFPFDITASI